MPRNYQTVEVNSFSKGLITEASPLTFPDGAAIAQDNFVLNRDGSINRRLGMQQQTGSLNSTTRFVNKVALTNVFEWDSPGGLVDRALLAIQDGSIVRFFDRARGSDLSTSEIGEVLVNAPADRKFSFAAVDNLLVVATGEDELTRIAFNGTSLTSSSYRLNLRDVFGVDDGLTTGQDVVSRPIDITDTHLYNLRNQTWASPRKLGNSEGAGDCVPFFRDNVTTRRVEVDTGREDRDGNPITEFQDVPVINASTYPSNADTVNQALFADVQDDDDRVGRRFFKNEVRNNPIGTTQAPRGFFIIDALARGQSRIARVQDLQLVNNYGLTVDALPEDRTPGGATVVQEYSGRVFYGGFSGAVQGGDDKSPQLSSYLLFSRLVRDPTDVGECYTQADPTSPDDFEQVATDGGFVRIDGASGIVGMTVLRNALYVFAENGVWSVSGGGEGFSSTDIIVNKVTDKGVLSNSSVVVTDQSLMYWSESGIFAIGPNEFGDYFPNNLSNTTVQTVYDSIPYTDKVNAVGVFDSYEQKARWVYGGNKEIIIDLNLTAFYTNTFHASRDVRSCFLIPPFNSSVTTEPVTVNGEQVTVNGADVAITFGERRNGLREVGYAVATERSDGSTAIAFATVSDPTFRDWGEFDATASLITGYTSLGDYQRYKNVPYLTLHFQRTENGFDEDFMPTNPSSCLVRAAWEWANSANSNRWTRQFQGYRYRRGYFATSADDPYDYGFETIITKNKLRGKGKVLSLHFETEPLKDCVLLGWSYIAGVAGNV